MTQKKLIVMLNVKYDLKKNLKCLGMTHRKNMRKTHTNIAEKIVFKKIIC
jgi:hypothetical protein